MSQNSDSSEPKIHIRHVPGSSESTYARMIVFKNPVHEYGSVSNYSRQNFLHGTRQHLPNFSTNAVTAPPSELSIAVRGSVPY